MGGEEGGWGGGGGGRNKGERVERVFCYNIEIFCSFSVCQGPIFCPFSLAWEHFVVFSFPNLRFLILLFSGVSALIYGEPLRSQRMLLSENSTHACCPARIRTGDPYLRQAGVLTIELNATTRKLSHTTSRIELRHTPHWADPHPAVSYATIRIELRHTRIKLPHTPQWAMPQSTLSYDTPALSYLTPPQWAMPQSTLSYATSRIELPHTPQWALPQSTLSYATPALSYASPRIELLHTPNCLSHAI